MKKVLRPLLYCVAGGMLFLGGWMIGTINHTLTPRINAPLPAGYVIWWFVALLMVLAGGICLYAALRIVGVERTAVVIIGIGILLLIAFHADMLLLLLAVVLVSITVVHGALTR
jgi:hypothetical protein